MSVSRSARTRPLAAVLLVALAALAVVRVTAPIRAERALQRASLAELAADSGREPDNPRMLYYLGVRAQEAGQGSLAMRAFLRACTLDPDDRKAWILWSFVAYDVQGGQAARDILLTFIKNHPDDALMHVQLAKLLERDADHNSAYEVAQRATRLDSRSAEAWKLLGTTALQLHDSTHAEPAFRHAIALRPQDSVSRAGLGDTYFLMARYPEAAGEYREAIRLDPESATACLALGQAQLKTAVTPVEIEAARASFQQALARPATLKTVGFYYCYLCQGQSYAQQANWKAALPWLKLAENIQPTAPDTNDDAHFDLARVYRAMNDPVDAARENAQHRGCVAYFVQARALSAHMGLHPDDTQAALRLARLYAAHQDYEDADQTYRTALAHAADKQAIRQEMAHVASHRLEPR